MHKRNAVRATLRGKRVAIAVAAAFVPLGEAYSLPTGENVVHGDVQVTRPTAQMMQINQGTQKGIVNWQGFSIGGSEHVNITQPNSSASLLNRVVGNDPSNIFGRLTANGQVFLVNNAGVFFAPGASVNAAAIVASTLSITDQSFLDNTYQFFNPGSAGSVVNQGSIVTAGGFTALIGPQVRNDGIILANSGKIALGAGNRVSLDMIGDGLVSISVDEAAFNASVINTGTLQADGGTVMLKASSANALLDTVINTSGIVRANSLIAVNGEIILDGGGAVQVAGTVEAIGGTINVSADSSLNVGSTVCCIPTQVVAGTQTIEAGAITVGGGASVITTSGSQTVTTPGTLLVRGGVQSGGIGLFHNGSGEQRVTAGNLELRGGSGTNTGAFINSNAGGDQVVTVTGALTITGGASGTGNRAGIISTGNQTINGNPDIVLTGGAGGGAGNNSNNVFIQATGPDTTQQTINARTIQLNAGAGIDASATINAARQVISTLGNVSLFGGGGLGGASNGARIGGLGGTTLGPTKLTLSVGGNLLLSGGSVNGVSLGSSGASTQANTIAVNAVGDITLESLGAGARIGSSGQVPVTPGNISVTAGGSLAMGTGTAVRANGPITLTANSLTSEGTITNGGGVNSSNIVLSANSFDLAGSSIQGGAGAVVLRPRDGTRSFGIEAAADTTLTNADIASINTSNFVVFGSGIGTTFTGNMTIGEISQVNGAGKNLAFFRSMNPGGTTTIGTQGVATTGDVIVSAGGGAIVSNGGRVAGDEVQLRAGQGIGAPGARVNTAANALGISNLGGAGIFVSEADAVTLRPISLNVGGMINNAGSNTAGTFDFTAGGDLTVNGFVSSNGAMNINVAGALSMVGSGGLDAVLLSDGGQTITARSITQMAQDGRRANIENTGGNQSVTATAGDMNLQVPGGFGVAQIVNNAPGGNQTITASGQLNVLGGVISPTSRNSGIFKNGGPGLQTVEAAGITLQGANTGTGASALISSQGEQLVDVTGGTINIFGGNGGNINNAAILASAAGQQTIRAHDINLANGFGGIDTVAAIQAGHQLIEATGNVTLSSQGAILGAAAGGPGVRIGAPQNTPAGSDITLRVGGNLTLNGGSVAENGAAIGSSGAGAAAPNTIFIDAGGNVILNAGTAPNTGVRIGSGSNGTAGGNITILADGSIALNGTERSAAIRTLDNVTLEAASISQGTNGFIHADTLTTITTGVTNLAGPNEIARFNGTSGGALTLVDGGALQVAGITTTNDAITVTTGSLTNAGTITNSGGTAPAGNMIFNADAFNLAGGTINAGSAAVILRPRTGTNSFGIESAGQTTLTNADIASINTSDFVVFGSSTGTIFTGTMTIGENARVEGNGKSLAFSRSLTPSAEMIIIGSQGVATTGDVILGAGGGGIRSNGGTITGDEVQLRASNGIGTPSARVNTAANALAINNAGGGGVFVSELDNVTLRTISLNVGGTFNTASNTNNGSFSLISGGDVNVAGLVSSGGSMIVDAGGALTITGSGAEDATLSSSGGQSITARSITQVGQNSRRANIVNAGGNQNVAATAGGISLQGNGGAGVAQIINNAPGGNQAISAAGQINVLGGAAPGSTNSGIFKNGAGGMQTINASGVTLQGASSGANAGALISSQGSQLVNVGGGNINLFGGSGGQNNNVAISAVGQQTIFAHDINLANGVGGIDTAATIVGSTQLIDVTGNVTLTAQGSLVSLGATVLPGVRIGAPGGGTTGTNLTLLVDGNLVLQGGSAPNNGASIGSSSTGLPQQNTIGIDVGGSVVLNSGSEANTGARIGYSSNNGPAGGNITITAGGAIALNGTGAATSIQTLGNVTLGAASITEAANGSIRANALTTTTSGDTSLAGPNAVSSFNGTSGGALSLNNAGPLTVTGLNAAGNASLVNALGDVTLTGQWNSASASIAAGGAIVESGAGAIQAASLTTDSVGASLTGANQVGVFDGRSMIDLVFNNVAPLEVARASASGSATLTSAGTMTISGPVSANNGISLTANGGSLVETGAGSITTGFGSLSTFSSGDTTLNSAANQVSSFNATSGGDVSLVTNGFLTVTGMNAVGDVAITDFGNTTVAGAWTAGGTSAITAGDILLSGTLISADVVLNASGSIAEIGAGAVIANALSTTAGGTTSLTGPNAVGSYQGVSSGNLTLNNTVALNVTGLQSGGHAALTNFGNVTLSGAWSSPSASITANGFGSSITETGAGAIHTGSLTTFSEGTTSLTGANQVQSFNGSTSFGGSGGITLHNTGALNVTALATGGNATLVNEGAVDVTGAWFSSGSTNITTTGGNLTLTNALSSGGAMELDIGGTLTVSANGPQTAQLIANNGGQTIRAQSVEVVAQNGGFATITNIAGGEQRITINGGGTGSGLDVHTQASGGLAQIFNQAGGFVQTIEVTDADHISVNSAGPGPFPGSGASISTFGGTQNVSITGSGANAITIGSVGARGGSSIGGGSIQNVTAGFAGQQGSVTIVGADTAQTFVGLSTNTVAGGMQSVSTSGTISVTGGRALTGAFSPGIFHNGSGQQTINAASISLNGGASGNNNAALISAGGGGNPLNGGAQVVNVSGDIDITGGPGGNAGIAGSATRQQTVRAHNISVTNSAGGGINSVGFIQGGRQEIHASGDVTLTARASGGDLPGVRIGGLAANPAAGLPAPGTDLRLFVGGDLVLNGGTAVNNGVGIGSTAATGLPPLTNDIMINAGGSVILNSGALAGTSARIGSSGATPTGPGNISITAGAGIELNGVSQSTAIRTLGNVTLTANHITEASNGFIVAGTLNTNTLGNQLLTGPNQVGSFNGFAAAGDVILNNAGALTVTGLSAFNAALTNAGDVTVGGLWNSIGTAITTTGAGSDLFVNDVVTSSGAMNLNVAGDVAVTADLGRSAMLTSSGGQTINARSLAVTSNGGFAQVRNSGPNAQTIHLADGAGLDVQTLAAGGFASVSADGGGAQTINVVNGDHINVRGANGVASISNFGGNQVLSITGSGANAITLGASGALGPSQVFGGVQSITAGAAGEAGSITIIGGDGNATFTGISSGQILGGTQTVSTSGNLRMVGGNAPNQPPNGFATGLFHNGSGQQTVNAAYLEMQGGSSGLNNLAIVISSGGGGTIAAGNQVVNVAGSLELAGGSGGGNNSAIIVSFADQTVNAGAVELTGGSGGANNGAFINIAGAGPAGSQSLNIAGDLKVAGGAGGSAGITGSANLQQTIFAANISLTNSAGGGINSVGFILGGHQDIHAAGNVTLIARASGGDLPGVRIGGLAGAAPTATDLTLNVGGDLILSGGTAVNNGVGIGSTAAAGVPPLENNITINAGGSVILNSGTLAGTGARIGSPGTATGPGSISVTADDGIELNGVSQGTAIRTLGTVTLVADHITEAANGFIVAGTLNTTTQGDQNLIGPNQVASFTASTSAGNVNLKNTAPVLTLGSMELPGSLSIVQAGTLSIPGTVSALSHAIDATGDVLVGSAGATNAALLYASGDISIETPGSVIVRGSDVTPLAASAVLADGNLQVTAGNVTIQGGGALLTPAAMRGEAVDISAASELRVKGGRGHLSPALLSSGSNINLTIGDAVRVDAGSGLLSLARIQTEIKNGVIHISFPDLSRGGYFVNGVEGRTHQGETGFFTLNKPAKVGKTLLLEYGD